MTTTMNNRKIKGKNCCVLKGLLKNLICEKKKGFGLDDNCYIRNKTICFRVKNKIFMVDCCWGNSSPLKDLKDTIVNILIEMSKSCNLWHHQDIWCLWIAWLKAPNSSTWLPHFKQNTATKQWKKQQRRVRLDFISSRTSCNATVTTLSTSVVKDLLWVMQTGHI